jgi:hypothetical protein
MLPKQGAWIACSMRMSMGIHSMLVVVLVLQWSVNWSAYSTEVKI